MSEKRLSVKDRMKMFEEKNFEQDLSATHFDCCLFNTTEQKSYECRSVGSTKIEELLKIIGKKYGISDVTKKFVFKKRGNENISKFKTIADYGKHKKLYLAITPCSSVGTINVSCFNQTRQASYEYKNVQNIETIENLEKIIRSRENLPQNMNIEFSNSGKIIVDKKKKCGEFKLGWRAFFKIKEKKIVQLTGGKIVPWSSKFLEIKERAEKGFQVVSESGEKFKEYFEVDSSLASVAEKESISNEEDEEIGEEVPEIQVNLETGECAVEENYCEMRIRMDGEFGIINVEEFRKAVAKRIGIPVERVNIRDITKGSNLFEISFNRFGIKKILHFAEDLNKGAKNLIASGIKVGKKIIKCLGAHFLKKKKLKPIVLMNESDTGASLYTIQKHLGVMPNYQKVEEFMKKEDGEIRKNLEEHIRRSHSSVKISEINLVSNPTLVKDFWKQWDSDKDNVKLVYRAIKEKYYDSTFKNNFKDNINVSTKLDPGFYGSGLYFTSHPLYALDYKKKYYKYYQWDEIKNEQVDWKSANCIIASYVACGKVYDEQIHDAKEFFGKPLKVGYDSHHVLVNESGMAVKDRKDAIYDEWVVNTNKRCFPRYVINLEVCEQIFIWRDMAIGNTENQSILGKLKNMVPFNIFWVETSEECFALIKQKKKVKAFYLMTNGGQGGSGDFIRAIRQYRKRVKDILVFCGNEAFHKNRAKGVTDCQITCSIDKVYEWFKLNLKKMKF